MGLGAHKSQTAAISRWALSTEGGVEAEEHRLVTCESSNTQDIILNGFQSPFFSNTSTQFV